MPQHLNIFKLNNVLHICMHKIRASVLCLSATATASFGWEVTYT